LSIARTSPSRFKLRYGGAYTGGLRQKLQDAMAADETEAAVTRNVLIALPLLIFAD